MKRILFAIFFVFCASIIYAQETRFYDFQNLFKKIELPFVIDSCSIQDLVAQDSKLSRIDKKMKKYIPDTLYEDLFKEQSVRAYFNIPISDRFISLMIFAGSFEDDFIVTNSTFYLVNYDVKGNVIDYIKVANYIFESGHFWCTINHNNIMYNSFETYKMPVSIKYDENKVIPMIENRYKYNIDSNGHFSKEILFSRKGFYEATYDGCVFKYCGDFPKE